MDFDDWKREKEWIEERERHFPKAFIELFKK